MKLIVGLGNPDKKYEFNRHNAGFMVLDYFAYKHGAVFKHENKLKCNITKTNCLDESLMLVKPTTYMNLSAQSVIAVMNFYKVEKTDVFVVYDDIALDLGRLRFRANGSDGGHNGIKSIIQAFGGENKFDRLKFGIGPQPPLMPSEAFVLQDFKDTELKALKDSIKKASEAIEYYLEHGIQKAQNEFNT